MAKSYYAPKRGIQAINMTPIIDVALVLVIILLITAPLLDAGGLKVDLPTTQTQDTRPGNRVNVTLDRAGAVAVDKVVITRQDLVTTLRARLAQPGQSRLLVVVRADGGTPYAAVRGVLDDARFAGARRLAVATTASFATDGEEVTWTP